MPPLRSPQKDLRERPLDGLLPTPVGLLTNSRFRRTSPNERR